MKIYRIALFLLVGFALLFASTQVLASPDNAPNDKKTPGANTPGAQATANAEDKDTQQADNLKGKRENFKGTVAAVDSASLTLTLRDGSSVTVSLSADTRMKFPGPKDSAPQGIEVGMTAMVQALRDSSDNLVARSVMVIPGKPGKIHRVGIVTEYTPGASITIQDKSGNTFNFTIAGEIKLLPEERAGDLVVGARVTIIAPRDPASGGVSVKGIVIHPAKP